MLHDSLHYVKWSLLVPLQKENVMYKPRNAMGFVTRNGSLQTLPTPSTKIARFPVSRENVEMSVSELTVK